MPEPGQGEARASAKVGSGAVEPEPEPGGARARAGVRAGPNELAGAGVLEATWPPTHRKVNQFLQKAANQFLVAGPQSIVAAGRLPILDAGRQPILAASQQTILGPGRQPASQLSAGQSAKAQKQFRRPLKVGCEEITQRPYLHALLCSVIYHVTHVVCSEDLVSYVPSLIEAQVPPSAASFPPWQRGEK